MTQQHLRIVRASEQTTRARMSTSQTKLAKLGDLLTSPEPSSPPPLEVCWTCEVCGPVAPFSLPTGRWIKCSCACQRREKQRHEQEELRQQWLREQSARTFGGWMGARWLDDDVIREMCGKTFNRYDALRQPEAFEKAFAFAMQPKGNLLFYGDYGTGKTHLETAICNYVREAGSRLSAGKRELMTSVFVSAPRFFMAYEETKRSADQTQHIRLMQQVMGTPLLVFDDIDKSRPTESRWETYWLIFDERCRARRPTVLSTNRREELERYVGAASLSRLARGLVAVRMVGDDYRREEEG
jgi:DNA replication protein DnaC